MASPFDEGGRAALSFSNLCKGLNMTKQRFWLAGALWISGLLCASSASAQNVPPANAPPANAPPANAPDKLDKAKTAAASVPLHLVPERFREGVKTAVEKTSMFSQGPVETFACEPPFYYWLLEHPDRCVGAWRKLGAQCVMISDRGNGRFGWTDEHGSDLQWEAVYHCGDRHIWYAEGKVRPATLLPLVPVKAVVVLHYRELDGPNGAKAIQHQADMFLHTDGVGAALATKIVGAAAPQMAEQCVAQMQTFFAGLAWYANKYPDRAPGLFLPATGN
jgi:hypothetical protein